jgi:hypothetical protein
VEGSRGFTVEHGNLEGVLVVRPTGVRIERNGMAQNDAIWDRFGYCL